MPGTTCPADDRLKQTASVVFAVGELLRRGLDQTTHEERTVGHSVEQEKQKWFVHIAGDHTRQATTHHYHRRRRSRLAALFIHLDESLKSSGVPTQLNDPPSFSKRIPHLLQLYIHVYCYRKNFIKYILESYDL